MTNTTIDRVNGPQITLPTNLMMPGAERIVADNGISLYTIHAGTQEVLRLSIVLCAGTRHQNAPFVASALMNMLSEGSDKYSSVQIAEMLDNYGIYYDTSIDRDYSVLTVSCLSKFVEQTLDLLEEVLLRPALNESELRTYCLKRKEQLTMEREKPSYIAREMFSVALFGAEHPYGKVSDVSCYDKLVENPELLRQFYDSHMVSGNMFAVASGMVTAEVVGRIVKLLDLVPSAASSDTTSASSSFFASSSLLSADSFVAPPVEFVAQSLQLRPAAVQSSIRIGKRLFTKNHPDFDAMQVVAMILGGYFGSRLVNNLREDKGYTYGIYSAMMNLQHDGYLAIATDVAAEHTHDSVTQIFAEIQNMRTSLVPTEELDMVRNIIVGEMMRIIDGPFGVADIMIEGVQNGCQDNSYLQAFLHTVKTITPEQVMELAVKYMDPGSFTTVIVGSGFAESDVFI